MALNPNFKEELLNELKKTSLLIDKSNRYKKVCDEYRLLKKSINEKLLSIDNAVCKDAECYINKQTGEFVPLDNLNLNSDLENMFNTLGKLYLQKQEFGWKDEIDWSVKIILELAPLKDLEKEIFAHFKTKEAKKIFNDAKIEVSKFEKENGICVYTNDIEDLDALNKILVLYSGLNDIYISRDNNLIEEIITLYTIDNEPIKFKKYGQINYGNKIYLDLEIIEKLNEQEFFIYVVEKENNNYKFTMEEDSDVFDEISELFERYTTKTLVNKNKKFRLY